MKKYAFWNNKGGTGKTSLAFQVICQFAHDHPDEQVLAIDVCPQGNLSELFFGGLQGKGSERLLKLHDFKLRRTIGGYFETRLTSPYAKIEGLDPFAFISKPNEHNRYIPKNVNLLAGDPILELQSNAMSSLANQQIPGLISWIKIVDWLNDFIDETNNKYSTIFLDLNPSFSMYTQIALAASNRVVIPIMADDSSRRAILNAFSLLYSLSLPSDIYKNYAFGQRLKNDERELPKVHLIVKNRITQYMGEASAYGEVLKTIIDEVEKLSTEHPEFFSKGFKNVNSTLINDFNTTGVVAFASGLPFFQMPEKGKTYSVGNKRVQVPLNQRNARAKDIKEFSDLL